MADSSQARLQKEPIWKAYWKLTRLHLWPAGSILFFWPCAWGVAMSAYALKLQPKDIAIQIVVYLLGNTIRHNAACIWNDICDRDFDRQVERTKNRPLASGLISVPAALTFLAAHCIVFAAVLSLAGREAMTVGLVCFFTLEAIYPLCKRFTNWPQAWLGFDCAWGLPVAWISNNGLVNMELVAVLAVGITCWTIHFDTIYACQDKEDDAKAGVHSCALLFGDWIRPILSCFAAAFVASLACAGYLNDHGPLYFAISVLGTGLHMVWQLTTADFVKDGWKIWKANDDLGYLIFGGILCDYAHRLMI